MYVGNEIKILKMSCNERVWVIELISEHLTTCMIMDSSTMATTDVNKFKVTVMKTI